MDEKNQQSQSWKVAYASRTVLIVILAIAGTAMILSVSWLLYDVLDRGMPRLVPSILIVTAITLVTVLLRFRFYSPEVKLTNGTLCIDQLSAVATQYKASVRIDEIRAILELPADNFLGEGDPPPQVVLIDDDGELHRFNSGMFEGRKQFRDFGDAIRAALRDHNNLEVAEAEGRQMKERLREHRGRLTPVSLGIGILLFAGFVVQSLVLGWQDLGVHSNRLFSELQLLDVGGLSREALVAGQWYRLMTASVIHSHLFEAVALAAVIATSGLLVERYLGGWRTAGLFILGALSGNAVALLFTSRELVVGAWGSAYAIVGAWLFLYFFRRYRLVVTDRFCHRRHIVIGGLAYLTVFNLFSYLTPALILTSTLSGFATGFVITWGFAINDTSQTSMGTKILASILLAIFLVGVASGKYHHLNGDLQQDRLRWTTHQVEMLSDKDSREHRDFFRAIYTATAYLDEAQRRELVRQAISTADFSLGKLHIGHIDRRERRDGAMCIFEEPNERRWHQMYIEALPTKVADHYTDTIMWECDQSGTARTESLLFE